MRRDGWGSVPEPRDQPLNQSAGNSFDGRHQILILKWPIMPLPVDEERRRAVHPAANPSGKIGPYPRLVNLPVQRVDQFRLRKTQLLGKRPIQPKAQLALVLKQQIVHLPKLPLAARKLRRLGCRLRVRMHLA